VRPPTFRSPPFSRSLRARRPRPPLARRARRLPLRRLRHSSAAFWLVAVALAGLAASAIATGAPPVDGAASPGPLRRVAVATGDFERGHRLAGDDVDWRDLPNTAVPPARASDTEGRIVIEPITKGEVIVEARLGPEGAHGTAALLPPDTRAIAIPLSLGAPPLEIGDRVDLLATLDVSSEEAATGQRVVARDTTVVAVEDDAVTVAVDEGDAVDTAVALANGAVVLALVSVE
jgi:Flp pilus assembly protein CpaB